MHTATTTSLVALAKQRIGELSARRGAVRDAIRTVEAKPPDILQPHEIEAMLERMPDLRPALETATPKELAEILEAFDIAVTYSKPERTL